MKTRQSVAFENRAAALQKHFVNRGYNATFVRGQIHRARMLDRNELFVPQQREYSEKSAHCGYISPSSTQYRGNIKRVTLPFKLFQ